VISPLRIFIGYDSREPISYHVLAHSIIARASIPVSISPVIRSQLGGAYTRARGPTETTEFSLTRFLVPYLSGFEGISIFMDSDMLCLADIAELLEEVDAQPDKSVLVCKHDYEPRSDTKFMGQGQTKYPRKNWSSLMVFRNQHFGPRRLTPEYVNEATGLELHRFAWVAEDKLGELPLEWNWLVGEYQHHNAAKLLHYTLGGPWFGDTKNCDHSNEWLKERAAMTWAAHG
jgi:lipopolysaccharide biosynthesis glycosyltransferase